jgi:hypothetical protein
MMKVTQIVLTATSLIAFTSGCAFEETALQHEDIIGTVRLPKAAVQLTLIDDETGEERIVEDTRAIGPVYLGAYPSVKEGLYPYLHPEMGPILETDTPGNTYPYGGTTVGRFDWACYESLQCKIVTGRFENWDDILEFFADTLESPVTDSQGEEVMTGTEFQEYCYEVMYYTNDDEVSFVTEEPDFEWSSDGEYLEAEVNLLHTLYMEGMAIWGWVDMPTASGDFSTCNPNDGEYHSYYADQFYAGANYDNLLNFPGLRIDEGDWIVDDPAIITDPDAEFEVTLGYQYDD